MKKQQHEKPLNPHGAVADSALCCSLFTLFQARRMRPCESFQLKERPRAQQLSLYCSGYTLFVNPLPPRLFFPVDTKYLLLLQIFKRELPAPLLHAGAWRVQVRRDRRGIPPFFPFFFFFFLFPPRDSAAADAVSFSSL